MKLILENYYEANIRKLYYNIILNIYNIIWHYLII